MQGWLVRVPLGWEKKGRLLFRDLSTLIVHRLIARYREWKISLKFSCMKFFWDPLRSWTSAPSGQGQPRKKTWFSCTPSDGVKVFSGRHVRPDVRLDVHEMSRPETLCLGCFPFLLTLGFWRLFSVVVLERASQSWSWNSQQYWWYFWVQVQPRNAQALAKPTAEKSTATQLWPAWSEAITDWLFSAGPTQANQDMNDFTSPPSPYSIQKHPESQVWICPSDYFWGFQSGLSKPCQMKNCNSRTAFDKCLTMSSPPNWRGVLECCEGKGGL